MTDKITIDRSVLQQALEAQLEALGADPDDEAVPANAAESYTQRVIEALYENGDPVSVDAAEELQRLAAQLEAVGAGGVRPGGRCQA